MQDLKGKRVGVDATALGGVMLARALEMNGMQPGDITPVLVPLFDHERAFRDHEVDAIITFEPRTSRLVAGGAVRLFDSSQIPGEIVDLLVVREETLQRSAPLIRSLVHSFFQAQEYARAHPDEANRQGAQREQISPEDFAASMAGLEVPDLAANRRMLNPGPGNLGPTLARLSALLVKRGLLKTPVDPAPLLRGDFLPEPVP
jgi:NitT/TauT family transport system substrate-binding protein